MPMIMAILFGSQWPAGQHSLLLYASPIPLWYTNLFTDPCYANEPLRLRGLGSMHCCCRPSRLSHVCWCLWRRYVDRSGMPSTIHLPTTLCTRLEFKFDCSSSIVRDVVQVYFQVRTRSVSFWCVRQPLLCSLSISLPSMIAINTSLNQSSIILTSLSISSTSWNSSPQPKSLRITAWHWCNAWQSRSSWSLGLVNRLSSFEVENARQRSSRKQRGVRVTTLMSLVEIPHVCWSQYTPLGCCQPAE